MVLRAEETLPGGVGNVEEGLHHASGLRTVLHTGNLGQSVACIARSAAMTNTSGWTLLPLAELPATSFAWGRVTNGVQTLSRTRLPFPCTPCVTYWQTNISPANTQTFNVRLTGFDQFGQPIQEMLSGSSFSMLSVAATSAEEGNATPGDPTDTFGRKTRAWFSKVFSVITKIEYQCVTTQAADDRIEVGIYFDFDFSTGLTAPYETYKNRTNQGIGTLFRMSPYGPSNPYVEAEFAGLTLTNLDNWHYPIASIATSGAPGTATITLGGVPSFAVLVIVTTGNPTVITWAAHGLPIGKRVLVKLALVGVGGATDPVPDIAGIWEALVVDANTIALPVNTTAAPAGATTAYIEGINIHGPLVTENIPMEIQGVTAASIAALGDINGIKIGRITATGTVTVPHAVGTAWDATTGTVRPLILPTCHVQAFRTQDLLWNTVGASEAMGGYRTGISAPGFRGTPHKWSIYHANAGMQNSVGAPLWESNTRITAGSVSRVHFIWPRGARVQFDAVYRTRLGTYRGVTAQSSYPS